MDNHVIIHTNSYAYKYLEISSSEIRLLKIHPAAGFDDLIEVTVTVEPIESQEKEYDAVSYCWGDAGDRCRIRLNDADCWITKSLHSALRHFRSAEDEGGTLWADGISIDQSNVEERGQQVALMGRIYSRAKSVKVYLGEATRNTKSAMELIKYCADKYSGNDEIVQRIIEDETSAVALTELLSRSYWQRMWVFQEIVLGGQVTIHCGSYTAPWDGLVKLDRVSGVGKYWFESQVRNEWIRALRKALLSISQYCIESSQARHLTNVLLPTRRLQATDPRDKLFALLGVSDFGDTLKPDYSRTPTEIYVSFSKNYMEQEVDLALLLTSGLCQSGNREDIGLPSWTPDYRGLEGIDIRYLAASYLKHFEAAGDTDKTISFNDQVMCAQGIIVGQINKTLPLAKGESRRQILADILNLKTTTNPQRLRNYFETMIFYETTMGGSLVDKGIARERKKERLTRLILGFAGDLQYYLETPSPTIMPISVSGFLESFRNCGLPDLEEKYQDLLSNDPETLHWYRQEYLSRSEEGLQETPASIFSSRNDLIGKGPGNLMKGDHVAVIYGCRVPLALRPVMENDRKSFYLVGPCYLSGMMNGEALQESKKSKGGPKIRILQLI